MNKAILKSLLSYVLIASIFITGEGITDIGFKLYWYYPFYLLFILYGFLAFRTIKVNILITLGFILLYSFLTFKTGFPLVVKQTFNISVSALVFYFFLAHENFDYVALFNKYTKFSKVVLALGLLQVICFLTNFGDFFLFVFPWLKSYDVSFRLQSITQEPSFYALTLAPIVFLSLHNILYRSIYFFNRTWSYLFILSYLLTLSSLAYFALLVMLLILYFKNFSLNKLRLISFAVVGIMSIGVLAYYSIPGIKLRVDDTIIAFSGDFFETDAYILVNPSTYSIASNYYITTKSFDENPLTGNGLGTYELIYDKYIPAKVASNPTDYFRMNRQDGAAMGLRLLSETGFIGLFLFLFFTIRFKIKSKKIISEQLDLLWVLNSGILVLIVLALARNGNYTAHGKILFLYLYYFTYRSHQAYLEKLVD